ncbi:ABC transporter ATP-binding protein [Aeromicrobium sp.]|uniref:ABC transporter ATP-binding protein n=1 Tax=Aeromicrobium sp. TaxID=1871063 RepID=UPI003C3FA802
MLTVSGLTTSYGSTSAVLDGVDLTASDGEIVAVLGSNGAGKSTLLRAISGTLGMHRGTLRSGEITIDGERLHGRQPAAITRAGVVQAPEGRQIFGRMSVVDNLRAGGLVTPRDRRDDALERVFDLFPRLAERRTQRAGLLSGGEQQMLSIGRALMSEPRLLLLDEPSLGLAPRLIEQIADIITTINDQGTTVVLVEQNAAMALSVSDRAVVLEVGRVAMSGPARELSESDEIRRLYLGGHAETEEQAEGDAEQAAAQRRSLTRWSR